MDSQDLKTWALYAAVAIVVLAVLLLWMIHRKGRPFTTGDVFGASRWTRGNRVFPTQVAITPTSVIQHTPRWVGTEEESIHIAHVASVKVDTHLLFSDVIIETSGGAEPHRGHRHRPGERHAHKALVD